MPKSPLSDRAPREFRQVAWDDALAAHVRNATSRWLAEDLGAECDWTSIGLIAAGSRGAADVVPRAAGVVAGLEAARCVAAAVDASLDWSPLIADGERVEAGRPVARLTGPVRSMLTAERTILNLMGRMSGVATAVRRLVDAVDGTSCRVYDTRKTVPDWRLLDKYAVRCGGVPGRDRLHLLREEHLRGVLQTDRRRPWHPQPDSRGGDRRRSERARGRRGPLTPP